MRYAGVLTIVGSAFMAPAVLAQSIFDGTWRPDPQIYSPTRKPDVLELANGVYACQSCTPPYTVKADGHDQPISGNPYYDSLSITTLDDRTVIKVGKQDRKTVAEVKVAVAVDGQTKTEVQTLFNMAPRPMEITMHSVRVAAGSPGSHLLSGTWRAIDADVSNHAEDTVFKVTGDVLAMSDGLGRSFSAKLDGTEAPYLGSEAADRVSLRKIDARTIEESDKKGGQVVKISRWTLDPDGKTMHVRFDDTHGHVQEQDGHKVE